MIDVTHLNKLLAPSLLSPVRFLGALNLGCTIILRKLLKINTLRIMVVTSTTPNRIRTYFPSYFCFSSCNGKNLMHDSMNSFHKSVRNSMVYELHNILPPFRNSCTICVVFTNSHLTL